MTLHLTPEVTNVENRTFSEFIGIIGAELDICTSFISKSYTIFGISPLQENCQRKLIQARGNM
jgi:hypothetical protein